MCSHGTHRDNLQAKQALLLRQPAVSVLLQSSLLLMSASSSMSFNHKRKQPIPHQGTSAQSPYYNREKNDTFSYINQ